MNRYVRLCITIAAPTTTSVSTLQGLVFVIVVDIAVS